MVKHQMGTHDRMIWAGSSPTGLRLVLAAALTIVLTLMLNTVAPASAAGFHAYSVAYYQATRVRSPGC